MSARWVFADLAEGRVGLAALFKDLDRPSTPRTRHLPHDHSPHRLGSAAPPVTFCLRVASTM
jgi:hypothetical protein